MPTPVETLAHAIERVRSLSSYSGYKDKETNIFAVVYECDQARQTRGTDMIITLSLMDDSMQSPTGHQVVELIVFGPSTNDLPQAQRGDIIELRHVLVQFWDPPTGGPSRPQLFGKLSRPHPFGYLLYKPAAPGAAAEAAQPYKTFNITRIGGEVAAQKLAALWPLASDLAGPTSTAREPSASPYLHRIKDLDAPEDPTRERPPCIDMRVQVLAVDRRKQDEEVVLFVWDATDVRPLPADLAMLPSIWRDAELKVSRPRRRTLPLVPTAGVDVVPELPPLGSAVPVVMEAGNVPRGGLPAVGSWIKLKVVGLLAVQGQMQVVFEHSSRITDAQPSTHFEAFYKTRLNNDDTSEWPADEARVSNIVTSCSRRDLRHITLRQVQQRAAQRHLGPFRVLLRLTGYLPRDLRQWCKPLPATPQQQQSSDAGNAAGAGSSSQQQQQQQPSWEWAAHLLLEDATGDLRALLLGREATRLLGLPPTDLSCHAEDVQQLQQRLDALSAVDQYGGTWMDVALTPVYTAVQQQQQKQQKQQDQQQQPQQQQPEAGTNEGSQEGHQQPGQEQQEAAAQPQQGEPAAAGQQQQQQPEQQQRDQHGTDQQQQGQGAGAAAAGGAGPSAQPARQPWLFIVHDAVCPHMLAEDELQLQEDGGQQPELEHAGDDGGQDSGGAGSSRKRPRAEAAAGSRSWAALQEGAHASGAAAARADGMQQKLDPAARAAREQRDAMAFM
ncbi:hypothetical protein OEZ86_010918 [Tetradesmus obliquus]|nr:hypothetical protein OEZ86_010918 [Tetradesmus obliquus]